LPATFTATERQQRDKAAGTTYGPYADELQQTNYLIEGVIGSII
jgi:hypothetical protein